MAGGATHVALAARFIRAFAEIFQQGVGSAGCGAEHEFLHGSDPCLHAFALTFVHLDRDYDVTRLLTRCRVYEIGGSGARYVVDGMEPRQGK